MLAERNGPALLPRQLSQALMWVQAAARAVKQFPHAPPCMSSTTEPSPGGVGASAREALVSRVGWI